MSEGSMVPENVVGSMAGREANSGRAERVTSEAFNTLLGKAEINTHQILQNTNPVQEQITMPISDNDQMRYDAAIKERAILTVRGGQTQGEYEKQMKNAKDDIKRASIQVEFAERMEPEPESVHHALSGFNNEKGEREVHAPIEAIQDIAEVENVIFDSEMSAHLKRQGIKAEALDEHQRRQVTQEVMDRVDKIVQHIGLNYLRGAVLSEISPSAGEVFSDRAMTQAGPYIIEARQRIEKKQKEK